MNPSAHDLDIWEQVGADNQAALYRGLPGLFQRAGQRIIGRWARPFVGSTVLDVGCGQGHHLLYAGNDYRWYIGLDLRTDFLVSSHLAGRDRIAGNAGILPLQSDSADCILATYCMEHLEPLRVCLAEMRRLLKMGGELLIALPIEGFWWKLGRRLITAPRGRWRYGIDYEAIARWEHRNSIGDVKQGLSGEGFVIVESRSVLSLIQCWRCV